MKEYTLTINNHPLHIHDTGAGPKGTIIGIHGLTGNGLQLSYYRDYFKSDYRFITLDLSGRANSPANDHEHNIFQHAADVSAIITELALAEVILIGYSMGAFIASLVASQSEKVKALVLLDGAATMSEHQRPIVEPSLGRLSKHFPSAEAYVDEVSTSYANLGIEKSQRLTDILTYEIEAKEDYWENKASEIIVRHDWETFWDFNIHEVGPKIKQPVLLVQASEGIGNHPPLFLAEHYEETIAQLKNIQVSIAAANHYTMVFNQRNDINQTISTFLEKL